jgi:poly(3-hydroxybutyrate) depolymerase
MMVALTRKLVGPVLFASRIGLSSASQVVLTDAVVNVPQTGNVAYTLPTERTFLLNVPAAYEHGGEPYPLVLSFHGG